MAFAAGVHHFSGWAGGVGCDGERAVPLDDNSTAVFQSDGNCSRCFINPGEAPPEDVTEVAEQVTILQTAIQEHRSAFDQAETDRKAAFEELRADLKNGAAEIVEHIKGRAAEADELLGIIGQEAMSSGYMQHAEKEDASADRLRKGAISCGAIGAVVLLGFSITAVLVNAPADFMLLATLTSGSFLGLATYLAKQSGHHRTRGECSRNLALRLKSLSPYLAPLPEETRHEKIEELTGVFFNPAQPVSDGSDDVIVPVQLQAAMQAKAKSKKKEKALPQSATEAETA